MRTPGIPDFDFIVRRALDEDRVWHDVTTNRLVGAAEISRARIIVKENAVV